MQTATQHRAHYDRQLQALREGILMLGSMAEKAVSRSVEASRLRDVNLARSVIEDDRKIDDYSYALEEQALLATATQQPLATDLRTIAASNFIVAELERIGDYAKGIAKITLSVAQDPPVNPLIDIPKMATVATSMLHRSLSAFIDGDLAACRAIWHQDDEIDALYNQVYLELLAFMLNDPSTIERATKLLWAAHNLERIADRVPNICERTAFVITGNPRALEQDA